MHKHEIILYWSNEDQAFIAVAPELPGCMAHGDDQEAALRNIKDAMQFWIERARELGRSVGVAEQVGRSPARSSPESGRGSSASTCERGSSERGFYFQGFKVSTPNGPKSATLRVTTVIPWVNAVAAMRASLSGRGSGTWSVPHRARHGGIDGENAARERPGNTFPSSHRRRTAACAGSRRATPSTPFSNSRIVMTDRKRLGAGTLFDHASTP